MNWCICPEYDQSTQLSVILPNERKSLIDLFADCRINSIRDWISSHFCCNCFRRSSTISTANWYHCSDSCLYQKHSTNHSRQYRNPMSSSVRSVGRHFVVMSRSFLRIIHRLGVGCWRFFRFIEHSNFYIKCERRTIRGKQAVGTCNT